MTTGPANKDEDFKIQYNCGCILFLFREEKTKRFQFDYERMVFYEASGSI
jgi:hypothetical protein